MPIYEYQCTECKARFQHLARQFDAPVPPCPACGSQDVEKLISTVNMNMGGPQAPAPQSSAGKAGSYTNLLQHGSDAEVVRAVAQAKKASK